MTLTLHDIKDRLKHVDEISLLEILEISSEDIIERFQDRIEDKQDELEEDLSDDERYDD